MSGHESSADINSLQEALAQQQQKITALREMVRQSDSAQGKASSSRSSTTEKVKNITKQLTQLKAKARGAFYSGETSATGADLEEAEVKPTLSHVSTPNPTPVKLQHQLSMPISAQAPSVSSTGSEKVQLLRQQMEQNKLRLAQRASSKLHLEQLVSELKEKLDSTQQSLDDTTQLGKSMSDLSEGLHFTAPVTSAVTTRQQREQRHRSATDLTSQPVFNLEKERIKFLENRCRLLEKQLEKERQAVTGKQSELDAAEEIKRKQELESRVVELEQLLQGSQQKVEPTEELQSKQQLEQRVLELEQQLLERSQYAESTEEPQKNRELENRILELEQLLQLQQQELETKTISAQQVTIENERLRLEINESTQKKQSTESFDEENEHDKESEHFELEELRNENSRMAKRIAELEEINNVLETTRCDLASSNSACNEKIQQLEDDLKKLNEEMSEMQRQCEETGKHTNDFIEDTESMIKTEMARQIQELQELNQQLVSENDKLKEAIASHEKVEVSDAQITAKISNLEATIESQREDITTYQKAISKLEEELMEKTIELNVLNANFRVLEEKLQTLSKSKSKPLFSTSTGDDSAESDADMQAEVQQLKQKLDDSNKAMIKLKLKCKQSEKQIEKLKKNSNLHEELIELQKTNEQLQQRITELEDEKGQWQLAQLKDNADQDDNNTDDVDNLNKTQAETVRLLEEQNYEQLQQLERLQKELEELKKHAQYQERVVVARVESEMSEIHLEEQLEEQKQQIKALKHQLDEKHAHDAALQQQNEDLQIEKQNLEKKLEHYLNENMELLDKVEKLSKSSSSAESIEIVDRLTQQEHAEMDEFNKRLGRVQQQTSQEDSTQHPTSVSELTQTEMGYELSESLVKLREESSELMNKVEMFTTERREVLEKMENLTTENHELLQRVEELTLQKIALESQIATADEAKGKLETELQALTRERETLSTQVAESTAQKAQLSRELTSMQKSSEIVAALENNDGCLTLFDKCEKSLSKLDAELEAYRRANDKNAKFNASKKLAKEAKNAHTQLSELLVKVKEASTAVETVTVVETVVAVTAPNGKALAEYEQLTAQNRELKTTVEELRSKLEELEDTSLHETISELVEIKPTEATSIDNNKKLEQIEPSEQSLAKLQQYEGECVALKTTVDELREKLSAINIENEAKSGEITRLNDEFKELKKISEKFEQMLNDKETAHAKQAEQFTRLRKELEGKCELYEGEMEILQTLVTEQKQQLIEAYKEHEHEMNLKLLDLQQRDEQITKLRTELTELRQASRAAGAELSDNLEKECDKLLESLRINKALAADQINELANKQETIDMLNQQLIDLYRTMEENTNKVIEKEDEIADLEATIAKNKIEFEHLRKDNEEQKAVVDKLLSELHSHKENKQQMAQLELEVQALSKAKFELENANKELEKRCKEQLEKMKKYAANLKKRATQCQELEAKIQEIESKPNDGELQQELTANVVLLNERISDYELKVKTQETHLAEIQEALQAKTIEILESMECNDKLEHEINTLKHELEQRDQAIVQLKNALAASQEQTTSANDWGDSAFEENNSELNEQLEKLQAELLETREIIMTKDQALKELHEEQQELQSKETAMKQEIMTLQTQFDQQKSKLVETDNQLQQHSQQLQKVTEELSAKSLKFEKSKAVIKERNNQIHRLQAQLKELQDQLAAQPEEEQVVQVVHQQAVPLMATPPKELQVNTVPKSDYDALQSAYDNLNAKYANEKSTFEQTIARLETLHDGIQAKLQEDMSYIETLEQENTRFKEKICKLEECVATFEERRSSMERRANLLDAQMQSRTDEYSKTEDELIYRLNMLSEHDEVIAQRLMESLEEKDDLQERLDKIQREFTELTAQHNKLEKEYKNFKEQSEAQLDSEMQVLRQKLKANEAETQRMRATYDAKMAAKTTEIDELESELSDQLARINAEKRVLQEDLEKSRDECTALKDEIVRVNESLNAAEQAKQESERELNWLRIQNDNAEQDEYEMQELRMQAMQDKTELDNLRQQIETLANNHQAETDALRMQIVDLDTLRMQVSQNQTDDQVFIETENKRLSDLLTEKEAIIAELQRQNLQLQMAAASATTMMRSPQQQQQPPDLFASIGTENTVPQISSNISDNVLLEQELFEKNALIGRLQAELENLREINSNSQRQSEVVNLRGTMPTDNISTASISAPASNDIIPAPPMFFASNEMTPSPFDEIIQRRHEQPQFSVAPNPFLPDALEQPTIEDLQRNVSDLEKYAQELEHKLAARNNQEEELHQRMNEARTRQVNAEQEIKHMEEQLQLMNKHLQEREQLQTHLEGRINQLEALLRERDQQLDAAAIKMLNENASAQHAAEIGQRLQATENLLRTREAEFHELKQQLDNIQQLSTELEAQIIPATETDSDKGGDLFKRNVAPSLDMFFGNTPATATTIFEDIIVPPQVPQVSDVPVIEDVIVPKKAYQCYPQGEETVPKGSTDFNLDFGDDVWGGNEDAHWGSNEAAAEATHFAQTAQSTTLLSREQQLELDLQVSNERNKELESTLEDSETQKQKLQEKLAKSLKVVSKYKTQNEELKKQNTGSTQGNFFDDLDVAIQDELKQQITKLETELTELHKQQKELALEKDKLLKRIDVLTAGNERMAEMKERQDMDMDMYKTRINELQRKLNKLEDWEGAPDESNRNSIMKEESTVVEAEASADAMNSKIQELESRVRVLIAEVEDLNGDKQELQALLDEERAAQSSQNHQRQLAELSVNHKNVCTELEALKSTHTNLEAVNRQLQNELSDLKRSAEKALSETAHCDELKQICMELENQLQNEQAQHVKENSMLESQCMELKKELEKLRTEWASASTTASTLPIVDLASNSATFDELSAQLQEKDAEIVHLKQRIEDLMREDQTEKLVLEILTKNQEIHMLKMQVKHLEDDKQELEHNLTLQITKEMQQQQQGQQAQQKNDVTTDLNEALKHVQQLKTQVEELQAEKRQMEEELNVLNAHVLSSLEMEDKLKTAALDLDMKNIEIKELRQTLDTLRSDAERSQTSNTVNLPSHPEVDINALNTRWEALVEQRCSEIAQMWRTHLEQREIEFQAIEQRLKTEIETLQKTQSTLTQLQAPVAATAAAPLPTQPQQSVSVDTSAAGSASSTPVSATSPSASADSSSAEVSKDCTPLHIINEADADELISKMQTALESQEMEIVSLKEQLAIRSAEYARLAAQYDPFKLQTGSNFDSPRSRGGETQAGVVPKSELDLAMYMLHQRDMRIEEMTVELVALLEERDTLQLKLSNTLRQMEAIKVHINYVEPSQSNTDAAGTTAVGTVTIMSSTDSPLKSMTSTGADDSADELHQKLSQLQTVNHSKDKLIKEEREHRTRQMERIRQIGRIQQDVAKIPPAAVSELIGSDISQTNQSPSSVLLNWLWGNKPPGSDGDSGAIN